MTTRLLRTGFLTALVAALLLVMILAPRAVKAADGATTNGATTSNAVAAGKKLVFNRHKGNCLACHVIAGGSQMGNVGPPLENMKKRYSHPQFLFERIYDETRFNPQTVMPAFGRNKALTEQEIHQIVAYLRTL